MKTSSFIAWVLCLATTGPSAHATLVVSDPNGVDVVYSSVSNVTWTQNANLLGNWISTRGFDAVYNDIAAAVPTVTLTFDFSGPRVHDLVPGDFSNFSGAYGRATFYGAYAFVQYLNSISYGGTNQWRLPSANNGVYPNPVVSGVTKAGDFGQLYYDELGSAGGFGILDPLGYFAGEEHAQYWSSTIFPGTDIVQPFGFNLAFGDQYFLNPDFSFYVWPVTNGTVAAVPEPVGWLLAVTSGTATVVVLACRRLLASQSIASRIWWAKLATPSPSDQPWHPSAVAEIKSCSRCARTACRLEKSP